MTRQQMICYDGEGFPRKCKLHPDEWRQDEMSWTPGSHRPYGPFRLSAGQNRLRNSTILPQSVLVTGHDILFFWVARMILMGEYAMGELPFPEIFLHGLIYGKSYWRDTTGGGISYVQRYGTARL